MERNYNIIIEGDMVQILEGKYKGIAGRIRNINNDVLLLEIGERHEDSEIELHKSKVKPLSFNISRRIITGEEQRLAMVQNGTYR